MMTKKNLAFLAIAALVSFAAAFLGSRLGGAREQGSAGEAASANIPFAIRKAADLFKNCKTETKSFCAQEDTVAKVARCLEVNKGALSDACFDDFIRVASIVIPCSDEIERFCSDVPAGGGRVHKCLIDHVSSLTGPCLKTMESSSK